MKQNAYIAGIGMTKFGKHLDRGLKSLAGEAINDAVADAGIGLGDMMWCSPAAWKSFITGTS